MLSDEIITLSPIIFGFMVFLFVAYFIKKISEMYRVRKTQVIKQSKQGMLNLPDSAYELFSQMETGLDMQVQEISAKINKEGKNPMEDTGYQTILNQFNTVRQWKQRFESNPMFILADSIGWPILKNLAPDVMRSAKRLLRYA